MEKKLDSADSELKRQEERIREEQQSAVTLRQNLQQLSEREREVSAAKRERDIYFLDYKVQPTISCTK